MSAVVFENQGVIDMRAIRTFGMSAKENENPIGFFGTGLKYAIAICLRKGQSVSLFAGLEKYHFETKVVQSRGKPFEVVTMNGEELPFTLDLGRNWELWQAFREMYCNTLDENGGVITAPEVHPEEGVTKFIVHGSDFHEQYMNRDDIVLRLPDRLKLVAGQIEIYDRPSRLLYYRGIRVFDFERPAIFTYNVKEDVDLTEDRTLKHAVLVLGRLGRAVSKMTDRVAIKKIITAPKEVAESEFTYYGIDLYDDYSPEFLEVCAEEYHRNNDALVDSAKGFVMKVMNKRAQKHYAPGEMTDVQKVQLERAKSVCKKLYSNFNDYPVVVVKSLGNNTMALADRDTDTIILSLACFTLGTKYVVSTLIEEYVHLAFGHSDCSRSMQTFLFDTISTLIETHVLKEPI